MSAFRDLSIRSKLMTGFMLTSLAALLLTLGALAAYDRMAFRGEGCATSIHWPGSSARTHRPRSP